MPDVLGSFISGAFGLAGSALNYGFQNQLAEKQNQYNLDMWRMQNEYNSPSAQMQRFKDAGLNPNLIYGQGSAGNAQSAPHMVTPKAPEVSEDMARLAQAFNIEGLKTQIAQRKQAQQAARLMRARADDAVSNNEALELLNGHYELNPHTGRFQLVSDDPQGRSLALGKLKSLVESNFRNSFLLSNRNALLGQQIRYLAPQISMADYESQNYPWSFWINKVAAPGAGALNNVAGTFNPAKWVIPKKLPRQTINYNTNYNPSWNKNY